MLRKASPIDTARILIQLKDHEDVNEALKCICKTQGYMVIEQ
jgi:hypothetical protein